MPMSIDIVLFFALCIYSYMLLYLLMDALFGFTVKNYVKHTIHYKDAGFLDSHEDIVGAFVYLKKRFNLPNVELYISQDMVVNAYAVGSMRKKAIVMTLGLIQRMYSQSSSQDAYVDAVKGILGHEMSHLINKDFLPGILVHSNEVAHRFMNRVIRGIFIILASVFLIIPRVGRTFYVLFVQAHVMIYYVSGLFFKLFFKPIYGFLYKCFSRSIEYRCDKDSAKVFGGKVMAHALSMLGKGAYFSIFSTHPKTKARISHVENIHPQPGTITPNVLSTFANIAAIIGLIGIIYVLATHININVSEFERQMVVPVQNKLMKFYWFIKTGY